MISLFHIFSRDAGEYIEQGVGDVKGQPHVAFSIIS